MAALRISILMMLLLLSGCDEPASKGSPEAEVASRALRPQQADLAAIYERSCRSCHTVAATGAPLTGDQAAWAPRMEKGMEALVGNVVNGFGGMPPLGLCMDCDAQQFTVLIEFMAAPAVSHD
jgi:cytochrome c5